MTHGKLYAALQCGCRCDECRDAVQAWSRRYRAEKTAWQRQKRERNRKRGLTGEGKPRAGAPAETRGRIWY